MKSSIKKLPKSEVEITIELDAEELKPYLEVAAKKIAQNAKIEGFRPGKASYEIIKQKFGEMAILQEAVDDIIAKTYFSAIEENELITIGQPHIHLEKMAPNNPLIYTAKAAILPKVEIGDYSQFKIEKQKNEVKPEEIEKIIEDIKKMRATQTLAEREAKMNDMVEIDFEIFRDGVPIENGIHKKYPVLLGENRFIPGFEDNLVGIKASDEKEFELKFPDAYHEKSLAGKKAQFKVNCLAVYEINLPEITDDFAKNVSGERFNTVKELKANIEENLIHEKNHETEHKIENDIWEELVKISKFDELPEILINNETHRMIHELEDNLSQQGLKIDDYLASQKKTKEELEKNFLPQAEIRVKTSILARQIFAEEKMNVSEEEIDTEIQKILVNYGNNEDAKKQITSENYKEYLRNVIGNRKVIKYLKEKIVK